MKRLLAIGALALATVSLAMQIPAPSALRRCLDDMNDLFQTSPAFEDGTYRVKLWTPMPKVVFLLFEKQTALTKTFLRFQEHFESPRFRQAVFSYKEFVQWYRADRKADRFTYLTDWSGMNFPSSNLVPFWRGDFNPLSERERWLLKLLKPYGSEFYLIATFSDPNGRIDGGMMSTIRHELSHSLYFLEPAYRDNVKKILARVDTAPIASIFDRRGGYHPSVYEDEFHAYLLNDSDRLEKWGLDLAPYTPAIRELNELFESEYAAWKAKHLPKADQSAEP